jgi:hypothetical protein
MSDDVTVIPPAGTEGITLKADDVVVMKESIGTVLKDYDAENPEASRGLAKIWDDCFRFQDTNELVRTNLYQIQVLLQKAFDEHILSEKRNRDYLKKLAEDKKDGTEATRELYRTEQDRIRKDRLADNAQMLKMAETAKALANEYRQCRTTQSYFLHITKVQQFALVILARVHQFIHQPDILAEISKAIKDESKKLLLDMEDKVVGK